MLRYAVARAGSGTLPVASVVERVPLAPRRLYHHRHSLRQLLHGGRPQRRSLHFQSHYSNFQKLPTHSTPRRRGIGGGGGGGGGGSSGPAPEHPPTPTSLTESLTDSGFTAPLLFAWLACGYWVDNMKRDDRRRLYVRYLTLLGVERPWLVHGSTYRTPVPAWFPGTGGEGAYGLAWSSNFLGMAAYFILSMAGTYKRSLPRFGVWAAVGVFFNWLAAIGVFEPTHYLSRTGDLIRREEVWDGRYPTDTILLEDGPIPIGWDDLPETFSITITTGDDNDASDAPVTVSVADPSRDSANSSRTSAPGLVATSSRRPDLAGQHLILSDESLPSLKARLRARSLPVHGTWRDLQLRLAEAEGVLDVSTDPVQEGSVVELRGLEDKPLDPSTDLPKAWTTARFNGWKATVLIPPLQYRPTSMENGKALDEIVDSNGDDINGLVIVKLLYRDDHGQVRTLQLAVRRRNVVVQAPRDKQLRM